MEYTIEWIGNQRQKQRKSMEMRIAAAVVGGGKKNIFVQLQFFLRLPEQNSWHLGHRVYSKEQTRSAKSFFHTCVVKSKNQKPQFEENSKLI